MKAFGFTVAFGLLGTVLALAACSNDGSQSQFVSSQARSKALIPDIRGKQPGQKKIGQFWWVWNTAYVGVGETKSLKVDCPDQYLPTGGGFYSDANGSGGYVQTINSWPNEDDGTPGWVVTGTPVGGGKDFELAVYVICAPLSGK